MKIYLLNLCISISFLLSVITAQPEPYIINDFNTANLASDEGDDPWWTEYDETEDDMNFSTLSFESYHRSPSSKELEGALAAIL